MMSSSGTCARGESEGGLSAVGAAGLSAVAATRGSAARAMASATEVTSGCAWSAVAEGVEGERAPSPDGSAESGESSGGSASTGAVSPVATASSTTSENSMGGGLRDLALRLGERGRGHHPAGERGRQAEAQKRPPSLLSHVGSPSLMGKSLPEYTPSPRFPQPRAGQSGLRAATGRVGDARSGRTVPGCGSGGLPAGAECVSRDSR